MKNIVVVVLHMLEISLSAISLSFVVEKKSAYCLSSEIRTSE
jgi:hypothetical protein